MPLSSRTFYTVFPMTASANGVLPYFTLFRIPYPVAHHPVVAETSAPGRRMLPVQDCMSHGGRLTVNAAQRRIHLLTAVLFTKIRDRTGTR